MSLKSVHRWSSALHLLIPMTALSIGSLARAQTLPKAAMEATKAANRAIQQSLNFDDRQDFEVPRAV
jgi:alkyl sulfatase BDS1-like metallo-beta-lactamase superfamily hydrolase